MLGLVVLGELGDTRHAKSSQGALQAGFQPRQLAMEPSRRYSHPSALRSMDAASIEHANGNKNEVARLESNGFTGATL